MFTADYHEKGMLYGKLLGSEHPHAIIKSIDTSAAEAIDGVVCIMTGKDVPEERTDGYIHDRHILVKKVARYIGDPIAAVAAVTEEAAEAAVEMCIRDRMYVGAGDRAAAPQLHHPDKGKR